MKGLIVEIKFEGGLGNQLFQYATGRSLCINNAIPFLLLNTSSYINQPLSRKFLLENLRVKGSIEKKNLVKNLFAPKTKLNTLISFFGTYKLIQENNFMLQDIFGQTKLLTSLKGYWQSEYYFKKIKNLLQQELIPKHIPVKPQWINHPNTVAVHVRRTDYLLEPRYGFIGIKYYQKAINYLGENLMSPLFIFFSDDIAWCKENFWGNNIIFFEDKLWKEDHLQLYIMSTCAHQIIANSTFSWWAAWLNSYGDKIVIRPRYPFRDNSLLYESHYPTEWIAIDNNEY